MPPTSDPPVVSEAKYRTVPGEVAHSTVLRATLSGIEQVDPRLIKAQIQSLQSAMQGFEQDFERALLKIKDPHARRALISLNLAIDMIYALLQITLADYLQELDERIEQLGKES